MSCPHGDRGPHDRRDPGWNFMLPPDDLVTELLFIARCGGPAMRAEIERVAREALEAENASAPKEHCNG